MNSNHILVTSQKNVSAHQSNSAPLKDGSQVLVRIIEKLGNNKFLGSVAGSRVNIYSDINYVKGDVFKANIFIKDGVVSLKAQNDVRTQIESQITLKNLTQNINLNFIEPVSSEALANFIRSMGMVSDNLSYMILQQMKNMGLKFDSGLMNKIHDIAAKYPGKERMAVELIMSFLAKGMEFNPDELQSILDSLEDEDKSEQFSENQTEKRSVLESGEIKEFIFSLLEAGTEQKMGLLSVANNLGVRKDNNNDGSWVILPYVIQEKEQNICNGLFRLLLSKEKKMLKFCIEANKSDLNQNFVLEFSGNQCKTIKICQRKDNVDFGNLELQKKIQEKLKDSGMNINVVVADYNQIAGNCFGENEIMLLDGEV